MMAVVAMTSFWKMMWTPMIALEDQEVCDD
jgi:hypothetical protein